MPVSISSHHVAALLIIIILHISSQAYSQVHTPFLTHCSDNNFTASSPYESNLRNLISNLVSYTPTSPTYFSLINSATSPTIYGLAQCRPDVSPEACEACLNDTATAAPKSKDGCAMRASGYLRYDNCLLIYSDQKFYNLPQKPIYVWQTADLQNASSNSFSRDVLNLVNSVIGLAAGEELRFAVRSANASEDPVNIYAMGWCSMDLATDDCFQCLQDVLKCMPAGKNKGKCVTVSCAVRFDTQQFYSNNMIIHPDEPAGKNNKTAAVAAGVFGIVAFLLLVTLFVILLRRRKMKLTASNKRLPMDEELSNGEIRLINFSDLKKATNNFAFQNKLGQGGFGPVYKGVLMNGQEVAVKRLSTTSKQGIQEMKNEIKFVVNLRHKNLVRLLGYCLQGEEKLLVYEFLRNTSLDKFLLHPIRKAHLDWETRMKIIVGVGRGLLYLHEDSHLRIVHRDLKASNILLDSDMNPKISDFGLAKLFNVNESERNTSRVAGTFGYMAPEYVMQGLFSTRSDVFSYGVLLLEIITGMKPTADEFEEADDLQSFVWQHWREGRALEVIDRSLENRYSEEQALRCVQIGLLCMQEDQGKRPKMGSVVMMLSSSSMMLETPSMPAFYMERSISVDSELASGSGEAELLERGTANRHIVLPGVGR